jgi:hypothetical protein
VDSIGAEATSEFRIVIDEERNAMAAAQTANSTARLHAFLV